MDNHRMLNERAWDLEVEKGNHWTRPVSSRSIDKARSGCIEMTLTPNRLVPASWCERLGRDVLALASGGGQQGPLIAASGRNVTVLDLSSRQLEQDERTAEANGLSLRTVKADMADLSAFGDGSFDSVVNPVSLNFHPDIDEVYSQVHRVLRPSGLFMFAVANPIMYMFDVGKLEKGRMKIRYTLPFSSQGSLSPAQRRRMARRGDTFEYSHTLETIIGHLCRTGFSIIDFYSDTSDFEPVDSYVQDCYIAMLCIKTDDPA